VSDFIHIKSDNHLDIVLNTFFSAFKVDPREVIPAAELKDKFLEDFKAFVDEDGLYVIPEDSFKKWFEDVNGMVVDKMLKELMDRGDAEMLWDAKTNDFAFRATKQGLDKFK
jgi:uncharacterized protein YfaA (DUF2138 family)